MSETVDSDAIAANPETLAGTAKERSNLHGFLAAIFREEVSPQLLQRLKDSQFAEALAEAGVDLNGELLRRPEEQLLEDLAVEYSRLFVGPGRHLSPHESVHTEGGSGRLWGRETVQVKRFIEFAGFEYKPGFHGLPDHISVELEFMAGIAGMESSAWQREDFAEAAKCLECEKEFMTEHLAKWAFVFCRKVAEEAELAFYREMARLTAGFLEAEKLEISRRLRIAAGEISGPDQEKGKDVISENLEPSEVKAAFPSRPSQS